MNDMHNRAIRELMKQIELRRQYLSLAKAELDRAAAKVSELERALRGLSQQLAERQGVVQSLTAQLAEREQQVEALSKQTEALQKQLTIIVTSRSWRLTEPVRRAMALVRGRPKVREKCRTLMEPCALMARGLVRWGRSSLRQLLRSIYLHLPLSYPAKIRLKGVMLCWFPFLRGLTASSTLYVAPGSRRVASILDVAVLRDPPTEGTKVLVVDQRIPTPDMTSGSTRLIAVTKMMLGLGYRVTFVSAAERDSYSYLLEPGMQVARYEAMLRSIGVERVLFGCSKAVEHLRVDGWRYRIAFLSSPEVTYQYLPAVRAYAVNARVMYDTVDLHSLRFEREAHLKRSREIGERADYYRKIELANIRAADVVIAVTPDEAARISEMAPGARVEVIPNVHEVAEHVAPPDTRHGVLFIGHYFHTPNIDAVQYFLDQVWPRVRHRLKDATLTLIGSNMPESLRRLREAGVKPLGYVQDLGPHFSQARVFVAPLRYGAGMKGKVGQAMSYGLPVVTTSIGAEGMGLVSGKHALIADEPQALADAVIALHNDDALWAAISKNGVDFIRERFSEDALRPSVAALLEEVAAVGETSAKLGGEGHESVWMPAR